MSVFGGIFFLYYMFTGDNKFLFGLIPAVFFIINSFVFYNASKNISRKSRIGANIIITGIILYIFFVTTGSLIEKGDRYMVMGIGAFMFIGIHLGAYITMIFVKKDKLMHKAMHKVDIPLPY